MRIWPLCMALSSMACGTTNESFEVKYASEFAPGPMAVSLFGVSQDGLLLEDAEEILGPSIFGAFHRGRCEVAFTDRLRQHNPDLFGSLDRQAREDGITDELLERAAPKAQGDFVVAFQMFGHPPGQAERASSRQPFLIAHSGGGPGLGVSPAREPKAITKFEVHTSFYSVKSRRTVAAVRMEYSGARVADAMTKLSVELRSLFPGATCIGWSLMPAPPGPVDGTSLTSGRTRRAL